MAASDDTWRTIAARGVINRAGRAGRGACMEKRLREKGMNPRRAAAIPNDFTAMPRTNRLQPGTSIMHSAIAPHNAGWLAQAHAGLHGSSHRCPLTPRRIFLYLDGHQQRKEVVQCLFPSA